MKIIGELKINSEKVIKNEELVNLRGGYIGECEGYQYFCICNGGGGQLIICGVPVYHCTYVYKNETGTDGDCYGNF